MTVRIHFDSGDLFFFCLFFIIILHGISFNLLQKQHRDNRKKGFSVYMETIITFLFQLRRLHCKRRGAANVTPNHSVRGSRNYIFFLYTYI